MQRNAKLTLTILVAVCTLPIVASYLIFFFWNPSSTANYGELLTPQELPESVAEGFDGGEVTRSTFAGKWTMFYVSSGECGQTCRQALYAMNQSWLAQGQEMKRVARVWLVDDAARPAPAVTEGMRELEIAQAPSEWLKQLSGYERGEHIYLVDPIGNVMMRYPPDPEIEKIIQDLEHLLKYSGLGR